MIIITNLYLLLISCYFLSQFLLINQCGMVFNKTYIENSTFLDSNFIFLCLRYFSNSIFWILKHCYYIRTSTFTTVFLANFANQINQLDFEEINTTVLAFSIRNAKINSNGVYYIQLNQTLIYIATFCNILLSVNSKSALNFWLLFLWANKILYPYCSILALATTLSIPFFWFL